MSISLALLYAPSGRKLGGMLTLPCLGGYLKRQGVDVAVIDAPLSGYDVPTTLEKLRELDPQIIGVSIPMSQMLYQSVEFMKLIRARLPDKLLICGGVHPTLVPWDVAPYCDAVVVGEGELTTFELVERYSRGNEWRETPGMCYVGSDGKLVYTPRREPVEDLDVIGGPDWSLIPFQRWANVYHYSIEGEKALPAISSRGCPFACTFCANDALTGRRLRYRSIPSFLDEIENNIETFGVRAFSFYDEVFTLKRERIRQFVDEVGRRNLRFRFIAQTRADCIEEEDILLLKRAGCAVLGFGLETADPEIMEKIKKKLDLDRVRQAVAACRKHEIACGLSFMLGTPWETFETLRNTFKFIDEVDPDAIGFFFFTPYQGTKIFQDALEMGGLKYINWSDTWSEGWNNEPEYCVYQAPGLQGVYPTRIRDAAMWHYYTRRLRRLKAYLSEATLRGGIPFLARYFRAARAMKKRGLRFS